MRSLDHAAGRASALICSEDGFYRSALESILLHRLQVARVIPVETFDQAVDQLAAAEGNIDLALFDLGMHGLDSRAAIRALRAWLPATRVVLVSASRSRRDVLVSLEAGVHGILARDTRVEGLIDALNRIRGGDIYVPPFLAQTAVAPERDAEASA